MKLKFTRKHAAIIILLIIILPIVYNKISAAIAGIIQKQMLIMPKEVVVGKPKTEDVLTTTEATGRVEAKYSVDVIARVSGFLTKKYCLPQQALSLRLFCSTGHCITERRPQPRSPISADC